MIHGFAWGVAAVIAIKLAGYTLAGWLVGRQVADPPPALVFGAVRTALGHAGFWALYGLLVLTHASFNGGQGDVRYLAMLAPVRFAEWWASLTLVFGRRGLGRELRLVDALIGTICSFALDVAAILAFASVPGALPVC